MRDLITFLRQYPKIWSKLKINLKRDKCVTKNFIVKFLDHEILIYSRTNGETAQSVDDRLEIIERIEDALEVLTEQHIK